MALDPIGLVAAMAGIFDRLRIPYYLCGSMASSVHGEPRSTRDVDFVAGIQIDKIAAFHAALGSDFYSDPEMIRDAIERRAHFNIVQLSDMLKVDIFLPPDSALFADEIQRAEMAMLGGVPVRVASAEDTLLAKLDWYRRGGESSERQRSDILGILKVQGSRLDLERLRELAARRGLEELLNKVLAQS